MSSRPPDILEVGLGELVFLAGALAGMGVGLAIAENLREWLLRGLNPPPGLMGYAVELATTILAVGIGGLWAGISLLAATVLTARLLAYYITTRPDTA